MGTFRIRAQAERASGPGGKLNEEEFADRFEAAFRTLWCIAAGVLGRRDEAEDVLQDAAMIALRKLGQFDPTTSFTAWMGQIVRYVALNRVRRDIRSRTTAADPQSLEERAAGRPPSPPAVRNGLTAHGEIEPDQAAFDDELLGALGALDPMARACLLLRVVVELPYRDVSAALGIPEGTAMSHVHRSKKELRRQLSPSHAPAGDRGGHAR